MIVASSGPVEFRDFTESGTRGSASQRGSMAVSPGLFSVGGSSIFFFLPNLVSPHDISGNTEPQLIWNTAEMSTSGRILFCERFDGGTDDNCRS